MDAIRAKYGKGAVYTAAQADDRPDGEEDGVPS